MSAARYDVLALGESLGLLVARDTGRLQHQRDMTLGFGGAESNVAIGVARLGGSAAWAGRLGADEVGDLIVRELRAEEVASFATRDDEAATALMLKARPRPGASRVTYYRAHQAGSRLRPDDVPREAIASARVLHLTGISAALGSGPAAAAHAAIDAARDAGALVSFDVNHRSALWSDQSDAAPAYRELATRADVLFAGNDEAELLTGATDPDDQLDALLALGARHAVVKLGARGAVSASADGSRAARDAYVVPVVDTVGAGDAFVAGWLTELVGGGSAEQRLDVAAACGALACAGPGDWESLPTRADIAALRSGAGDPVAR